MTSRNLTSNLSVCSSLSTSTRYMFTACTSMYHVYNNSVKNQNKSRIQPEGTQRVRTHVRLLLTLTLTFDLSTQKRTTCRISQGHYLQQVWTLWDHSFLSYALLVWKMNLLTLWTWSLTFQPQIQVNYMVPSLNSLWYSFLSYAADKQSNEHRNPIHADRHSRRG